MNDPVPPPGLVARLNRIALHNEPPVSWGSLDKKRQTLRRKLHRLRDEATDVYRQLQTLEAEIERLAPPRKEQTGKASRVESPSQESI